MFLNGGYFRARIASITPFDKIIGGLAWSITASNADVSFDLFFDEDANLGQKIQLSENIEKSLVVMKCPHPVQAHQIQGLDYPAVFPAVRWLIKKVIATREEFGDRLRRFATYSYGKGYDYNSLEPTVKDISSITNSVPSYRVQRRLRPRVGVSPPEDPAARVRMVLVEYGHSPSQLSRGSDAPKPKEGASPLAAGVKGLSLESPPPRAEESRMKAQLAELASGMAQEGEDDGSVSRSRAAQIMGLRSDEHRAAFLKYNQELVQAEGLATRQANMQKQKDSLEKQLAAEQQRLSKQQGVTAAAVRAAEVAEAELNTQLAHNERCLNEKEKLNNKLKTPEDVKRAKALLALIKKIAQLKKEEAEFRGDCKKKMGEMQEQLEKQKTKGASGLTPKEEERIAEINAAHKKDFAKWEAMRASLAKRSRAVALLSRKLDEMPARPELMQYEKRFEELYEQITAKLEETRRYYAIFNTLQDTKKLLTKEISLLNSIQAQFDTAMGNYEGKGKFLNSVKGINDGLEQNYDKSNTKLDHEKHTLRILQERHVASISKQRAYYNCVKEFQEVCVRGDYLRAKLQRIC